MDRQDVQGSAISSLQKEQEMCLCWRLLVLHCCKWLHLLAGKNSRQGRVRLGLARRSLRRGRDVLEFRGAFCKLPTEQFLLLECQ